MSDDTLSQLVAASSGSHWLLRGCLARGRDLRTHLPALRRTASAGAGHDIINKL